MLNCIWLEKRQGEVVHPTAAGTHSPTGTADEVPGQEWSTEAAGGDCEGAGEGNCQDGEAHAAQRHHSQTSRYSQLRSAHRDRAIALSITKYHT